MILTGTAILGDSRPGSNGNTKGKLHSPEFHNRNLTKNSSFVSYVGYFFLWGGEFYFSLRDLVRLF